MNARDFRNKLIKLGSLALLGLSLAAIPFQSAFAGVRGGARALSDLLIRARSVQEWKLTFRGGEMARVQAQGDGDIDLYVYDSNGRLVARDTLDDSRPEVDWYVSSTQQYTIHIVDNEYEEVEYDIQTN